MSAVGNFMNLFFPEYMAERQVDMARKMRDERQKMNMEALSPFISRNIISQEQVPFMADTFSQGDPFREADLNQLREQGMGGLSSVQEVVRQQPGFFDEQQAQQLSSLFSGPQGPEQLTQLVASRMMPQQKENMFAKIAPKDYTQESVSEFQRTGNFASLVPAKQTDATKELEERFKNSRALRGEFTQVTKNFADINDAFGRIKVSAESPSPAGDLSLLFNYMKMLDPQSVVRESEFAAAAQAGSYGARIQGLVNRALSGQMLADTQRVDFVDRAKKLYGESARMHSETVDEYKRLSRSLGVPETDVIFERQFHAVSQGSAPQNPQDRTAGLVYDTPKGPLKWTGTGWVKP